MEDYEVDEDLDLGGQFASVLEKKDSEPTEELALAVIPNEAASSGNRARVLEAEMKMVKREAASSSSQAKVSQAELKTVQRDYSYLRLAQDDLEDLKTWLLEDAETEKPPPKGKKSKKKASGSGKQVMKKPAKARAKGAGYETKEQHRTTKRHRVTSSAYNKAKNEAIKAGLSPNKVKQRARTAFAKAAAAYDEAHG